MEQRHICSGRGGMDTPVTQKLSAMDGCSTELCAARRHVYRGASRNALMGRCSTACCTDKCDTEAQTEAEWGNRHFLDSETSPYGGGTDIGVTWALTFN